jgi:hypothetical protein
VYQGPAKLICDGYRLDKGGMPTFLYRVAAGKEMVQISERPEPVRGPLANGLTRRFMLEIPAKQALWFLASDSERKPEFLYLREKITKELPERLRTPGGEFFRASAERVVLIPQGGDRGVLLQLGGDVQGLSWRARQEKNGRWNVFLHVPADSEVRHRNVEVRVLVPHRNEPDALQELLGKKE